MGRSSVLVLYVSAGGGHRAAALALQEAARDRGVDVELLDALSLGPKWYARAYVETHLLGSGYAPSLYGRAFALSNRPDPVRDGLRSALDPSLGRALHEFVRARRPAAVVCTHFNPLVALGRMRLEGELAAPLIAVVTDYVTHAVWSAPGVDLYCVPPGRAAADLERHGRHGARVVATGIPIRGGFGRVPPWSAPAPGEPLSVLLTSGGFGVGPVREALRGLRHVPDLSVDVVCGNRPHLVRRARRYAARRGLNAVVDGFVDDMPARLGRAHVVVGKPGGLTMSECLAAGRPLVAVGTCPGQEAGNEATLVEWGAGVGCGPAEVGLALAGLRAGGRLASMAERARAHGRPGAARAVFDALDALGVVGGRARGTGRAA
jgi:processive 1,2-diacylglycerol beta-glucosyltransferase